MSSGIQNTTLALAPIIAIGLCAGVAFAGSTPSETTSKAKDQVTVRSPSNSPVTVGDAKKGKPLEDGDAVVSRAVTVTRGKESPKSSNAVTLTCPGSRSVSAVTDSKLPFTYNHDKTIGKSSAKLYPDARSVKVGKSLSGTLYALCVSHA